MINSNYDKTVENLRKKVLDWLIMLQTIKNV